MSSSSCLLLPRQPHTFILPFIFPSITCFIRQFVPNKRPTQLAFLLFIVCRIFLSSSTRWYTSFLTRSVQLISILLHHVAKLPGFSNLRSEVSKFWHHTKLCSKCSTLLVSSLNSAIRSRPSSPNSWSRLQLQVHHHLL